MYNHNVQLHFILNKKKLCNEIDFNNKTMPEPKTMPLFSTETSQFQSLPYRRS